ncbi:MAG: carbohydrate ABC transporter substrate-binding protein [Actinomycetaceae bacterium]|nr:carbohydrate ABC transporter substrate-binding protein [Actinomycetaceae bacterium]
MASYKRLLAVAAATSLMLGGIAACSEPNSATDDGTVEGRVYLLTWHPEQEEALKNIADVYTAETGVDVKIVTATADAYEQTLRTEMSKSEPPTIFQLDGPVDLASWQDYTLDISDMELTGLLVDENFALKDDDGKVYGIPAAIDGYGIIYNDAIMRTYFETEDAVVASMDEVNNFATLQAVVEDMQSKADELGIEGVFSATSLSPGEEWRWQAHLSNIAIFYEYQDDNVTDKQEIAFSYNENFRNIFNLYLNNSTVERAQASSKTVTDSMTEFATGQSAMVQNGNWAWDQIAEVEGSIVLEEDIKFLPIYIGVEGEENQGLAVGAEAFMAVNSQVDKDDQQASIDFLNWLYTSDEGKELVLNDLGYLAPYTSFAQDEVPANPLVAEIQRYLADEDKYVVPWVFNTYPSEFFKAEFAQALTEYVSGAMEWDGVVALFVEEWAAEKQLNAQYDAE